MTTKAPRPADADIPAAVRAAFSGNRVQGAWNMAALATDSNDRMSGINAVCRLLEVEGLTLHDVLTAVLSVPAPAPGRSRAAGSHDPFAPDMARPSSSQRPRSDSSFAADFSDMFADMFSELNAARRQANAQAGRPETSASPPPRQPSRKIVQGLEVPSSISGTVGISDVRPIANGMMLTFSITDDSCPYEHRVYSPLVCFSQTVIDVLEGAAKYGRRVHVAIRAPKNPAHQPCATMARVAGE